MEFADLQSSSSLTLEDGTIVTTCDRCKERYAERKPPGTPPCESCRVELRAENEEAGTIYMMTRRQIVTFHNGEHDTEIDINHAAVWAMIDHWPGGIRDPFGVFRKVIKTYHSILKEGGT